MIRVIIGPSGAGKTTLALKWRGASPAVPYQDIVACTQYGKDRIFIGKYETGERCQGTDTLSYSAIPKILEQIDKLYPLFPLIVAEGDRINNPRFFQHLLMKRYQVELYHLDVPLEVSMERLREAGSKITETFVKTTGTKARNNFTKYRTFFNGQYLKGC